MKTHLHPPLNAQRSTFNRVLLAILVVSSLILPPSAFAQGPLTPPGPPAPTFKTLQQIEPRTPITNTTAVTISTPGSYYLTTNIAVTAGNAITIAADNVTLDLNGFTISSTEASPTGAGILLSSIRMRIHILNGHITGNVAPTGFFTGSGFANGITAVNAPYNVRVSGVSVAGCAASGINLGGTETATIVESCTVAAIGTVGINAEVVTDSATAHCGSYGIFAHVASNCHGEGDSAEGVHADTANNCRGISFTGTGLHATRIANGCQGVTASTGAMALWSEGTANVCSGENVPGGTAIRAVIGIGCVRFGGTNNISNPFLGTVSP